MGSFYLVNVILAIVAMAYKDCSQKSAEEAAELDKAEAEAALAANPGLKTDSAKAAPGDDVEVNGKPLKTRSVCLKLGELPVFSNFSYF